MLTFMYITTNRRVYVIRILEDTRRKKLIMKEKKEEKDSKKSKFTLLEEEIESLKEELESLKAHMDKQKNEYQHASQVLQRELAKQRYLATEEIIRDLIPVLDSLEEAFKLDQVDNQSIKEGMTMVLKNIVSIVERHGINTFGKQGEMFSPNEHEIFSKEVNIDYSPDTILRVLRKGYRLGNTVIRPALVILSAEPKLEEKKED